MSLENVEAFKRGAEAYNRRDVDALLKELDPEVEWHSALLIPFGGKATVSRGHGGVLQLLGEVYAAFAEIHLDYSDIRDLGDRIVGTGRLRTQGKHSGAVVEMAFGTVTDMENGKAIRIWTYLDPKEALVAGLSEAMSQENVEIVRGIYDAFNRRDWDAAFRDADLDFALTTQLGPDAGTRRGREAVVAFADEYSGAFDTLTWEPEEFFAGRDRVVAVVSVRSRPRGGGVDLVVRNGHLWTIHNGVVVSMESFPKPKSALEAAGLEA